MVHCQPQCSFGEAIKSLTGRPGSIHEVRFSNAAPKQVCAYQNAFGCQVRFQSGQSELFIHKLIMERPVLLANPDLLAGFESMATRLINQLSTENGMRHKTARAIGQMLTGGETPSIAAVAEMMAISARRLQQKLKSEQTGYRAILDLVRKETALRLLQDPGTTISEITFILGFSDQSNFTHAFQVWTGTTPGKYRKQQTTNPYKAVDDPT